MAVRHLPLLLFAAACAASKADGDGPRPMWPPPPDPPRVQFLASYSGSKDLESGPTALDRFLFGEEAEADRPIQRPIGVFVRDGVAYALDAQLMVIHRLDLTTRQLDAIVPSGRGELQVPTDMHVGTDGLVYIADRGRRQVLVFDRDWTLVRELGPWGDAKACVPLAVALWKNRVLVADSAVRNVRVVDAVTGEQVDTLHADPNSAESSLRAPTGLAVDQHGYVYVVDAIYQRVLVFDEKFDFVRKLGESGDAPGSFGRPKAVAVDGPIVFVLDSLYEHCQMLDRNGHPLMYFGAGGVAPGNLYLPRGLWIGTEGLERFRDQLEPGFVPERLIAVTSFYGPRKLSFFALGRSETPDSKDRYAVYDLPEKTTPEGPEPVPASTGK